MENLTAKQISINYLESVKKELENTLNRDTSNLTLLEWYSLETNIEVLSDAIDIVKEREEKQ